jgi:DNA-binding NtrC family response regulator
MPSVIKDPRTVPEIFTGTSQLNLAHCKLVVLSGAQKGAEISFLGEVLRIGKAAENDLQLTDENISRSHCEVRLDAQGYLLRDLGSTNGTTLEGARIREAYLRPGALFGVGRVQIRFMPLEQQVRLLPSEKTELGELRGRSLPMREIYAVIERIAPTEATVLLQGETGVGKDVVARTLHALSHRARGPWVVVDCGALAPNLVESELFGHEKGAFTGAVEARKGAFEVADGGTLFLDEIGELPVDLQPKLLRALESREIRRVGGTRAQRVDIRVVAATRRNLRSEVERGRFREDLFFRLAVVLITVPALRDRREDIPVLVEHLLAQAPPGDDEGPPRLPPGAMAILGAHDWPGNVRELRNVVERMVSLGEDPGRMGLLGGGPIGGARPESTRAAHGDDAGVQFDPAISHSDNKERWNEHFERLYLTWLLERTGHNVSQAAREAQMDRKYLHRLMRRYGLD